MVKEKNSELRQERDEVENSYHKAAVIAMQRKQDEASLKWAIMELCSELLNMQLEPNASILDNVQKVVVCAQALVVRMDTVEAEYKARIEELEKRDPSEKLKVESKEISHKIEQQIQDTTHLLETTTSSWMGIEQIDVIEEVCKEINQAEANIGKLKEEMTGLPLVQRMIKSDESKKFQIQLQKLRKEETKFLQFTQPWQDELVGLTLQVETKIA